MSRTSSSLLLTLALLLQASPVLAQNGGEMNENFVEFPLGNDLYTAGDTIDVTSNLPGDLNAAGNRVIIRGTVNGDVQAAGANVTIDSTVRDDVRIAAGEVTINGTIDGDVIIFAGKVYISKGSTIVGNLVIMGGEATIEGAVRGTVRIDADNLKMNGSISDDAVLKAGTVSIAGSIGSGAIVEATDIIMSPTARIGGTLRYWQKDGQESFGGTHSGTLIFDPELQPEQTGKQTDTGTLALIIGAVSLVALLYAALTIGVFMLATKTFFIDAAKYLNREPGWAFLWGLLWYLLAPVCAILLMITVIGFPLGLGLMLLWGITVLLSYALTALVLARWAELRATHGKKKKWHPAAVYFAALGIYVLMQLIEIVPFVGILADFIVVTMAYGAIMLAKTERYKKIR